MELYNNTVERYLFEQHQLVVKKKGNHDFSYFANILKQCPNGNKGIMLLLNHQCYPINVHYNASRRNIFLYPTEEFCLPLQKIFGYREGMSSEAVRRLGRIRISDTIPGTEEELPIDRPFTYYVECIPTNASPDVIEEIETEKQQNRQIAQAYQDCEIHEGTPIERKHIVYERDYRAVRNAKERFIVQHGYLFCEVCGFRFDVHYGERGADYIEIHHSIPVSELGENGITRPEDLRMVCSNCHRMIHRKKPWLTIDELREQFGG